jgi:hypothetical protein
MDDLWSALSPALNHVGFAGGVAIRPSRLDEQPANMAIAGLLDVLVERFEALAQGEHSIDLFLHDEVLCRLLEIDLLHPAVVCLSPIAFAAKALAVAQQDKLSETNFVINPSCSDELKIIAAILESDEMRLRSGLAAHGVTFESRDLMINLSAI